MSTRTDRQGSEAEFSIEVDGQQLPQRVSWRVQGFSVEQSTELPGSFALELQLGDDDASDRSWFDTETPFAIGSEVKLSAGYGSGTLTPLSTGEITALEAEFGAGRAPRLTVRGFDRRHRLQRGLRIRTFSKMKDSDIARKIAQEAGLEAQVTDSKLLHDYLIQANQTDLDFLLERAQRINFEILLDAHKLLFRPTANLAAPSLRLSMADDSLTEFRVQLSSTGQVSDTSVRGWDPSKKQSIVALAPAGKAAAMGTTSGASLAKRSFGTATALIATTPVASNVEADQLATAALERLMLPLMRGEGLCPGRPQLQAGKVVEVADAGKRFDGRYYITSAQHRFEPDNGYTTRFGAWRNST